MRSSPYYYSGNAPVIQGRIPPKIPRRFFRKQNAGGNLLSPVPACGSLFGLRRVQNADRIPVRVEQRAGRSACHRLFQRVDFQHGVPGNRPVVLLSPFTRSVQRTAPPAFSPETTTRARSGSEYWYAPHPLSRVPPPKYRYRPPKRMASKIRSCISVGVRIRFPLSPAGRFSPYFDLTAFARSRQVQNAKRTVRCFSQSFYRYNVSDQTSSMIAISAASPRRGPSFVMRV